MRKTGAVDEVLQLRWVSRLWLSWRGWNAGLCSSGAEILRWRIGVTVIVAKLEEEGREEEEQTVVVLDLRDEMSEKKLRMPMLAFRESWGVDSGETPCVIPDVQESCGETEHGWGVDAGRGVLDGFREAGRVVRSLPSLPFRTLRARDDLRQVSRRRYVSRAS